ncbi:MAG: FAD-binding oxidoreductase [Acidobacteria bacterium]|nr:FAD-binding oxidoreductase [Acidobacteriota bacterium]
MTHPIVQHWHQISEAPLPQIFRPEKAAELQQLLQDSNGAFLLCGNGSKWWLGNPPGAVAGCIDLTGLNRVTEYSPGDMTVSVEAGTSLSELNAVLSEHDQVFPADPPASREATVGGIIAVGISGPLQQRYGMVRDKVLGIQVMHPDGTATRAGGRVVKNVAGYDLCKLYTGSLGTLAVVLEVTLRVFPAWRVLRSLALPASDSGQAKTMFLALRGMPVEPAGVFFLQQAGERPHLLVRVCGTASSVEDQVSRLTRRFPDARIEEADMIALALDNFYRGRSPLCLRAESSLDCLTQVERLLRAEIQIEDGIVDFSSSRCHFAAGSATAEALGRAREELKKLNAALIIEKAPLALKKQIDAWGSARDDLPLARRLKFSLDPQARFNPGRYVAGI